MEPYIYITSLTVHRIDELLADYMEESIETYSDSANAIRRVPSAKEVDLEADVSVLFVTNGVINASIEPDEHTQGVLYAMRKMRSFYFIDDHTTWVPGTLEFPLCTVVSQFTRDGVIGIHPMLATEGKWKYFPISNLAVCMETYNEPKDYEFVYWGHMKPERMNMYKKYIPNDPSTLIIGEKEWKQHFPAITLVPYERDMDNLYMLISQGKKTAVFGDDYHNGINVPWRIYEAQACNVEVHIDEKLLYGRALPQHKPSDLGKMLVELSGINFDTIIEDTCCPAEELVDATSLPDDYIDDRLVVCSNKPNTQQEHTETNVDNILAQRATLYGTYKGGVDCRADMLLALNTKYKETHDGSSMPIDLVVLLGDLVLKMMRIVSDPTHQDSYIDLAGYAKLIKEMKCDI